MKGVIIILALVVLVGGGAFILTREDKEVVDPDINDIEESFVKGEMEHEEFMGIIERAKEVSYVSYDVEMDSPSQKLEGKMWQKGDKIRMEGNVMGEETVVIMDNEERTVHTYFPDRDVATKVDFSDVEEVKESSAKYQAEELPERNPVVIGRETVNGMECIVVEYAQNEESTGKMWIWEEHGLPVKFEINETVTEIKNVVFDEFSDDKFELPEGTPVVEVPTSTDDIMNDIPDDIMDHVPDDFDDIDIDSMIPEF